MKLTSAQSKKLNSFSTKSAKIRYLLKLKKSRGEIAKHLKIKYQHVRNVEITPIKTPKEKF